MILEALFNLIFIFLEIVFTPVSLPNFPDEIMEIIETVKGYMIGAVDLLGFFLDWNVVKILIPIVIAIANLDKIWKLIIFILRKIPFLGIE